LKAKSSTEEQKYVQARVDKLWLFDSFSDDVEDMRDALAILIEK
jgi:hypothetical protein